MPKRLTKETLDPARDPSGVNKDRAHGGRSDDTKVDAIRTISTGWRSASILHDLRNPLGTICAGAELLIELDSTSIQVKRLAANMARAAERMRRLLADLT